MSEMVDRVAKAIREAMDSEVPMEGDYHVMAHAAIEAMREPTEWMLDRLDMANSGWAVREHSKELWQELIDVVLTDGK